MANTTFLHIFYVFYFLLNFHVFYVFDTFFKTRVRIRPGLAFYECFYVIKSPNYDTKPQTQESTKNNTLESWYEAAKMLKSHQLTKSHLKWPEMTPFDLKMTSNDLKWLFLTLEWPFLA